ncbi:MBL fold metallo-hydrolase [Krasilnikovia sp. MM14-A1004]|uniref:MBL fold metallo-hydrolase n=1 Tax=Krasilnikovia sp. MM14-A1004 TaxID=3373541 RepID=UPI00399D3FFC
MLVDPYGVIRAYLGPWPAHLLVEIDPAVTEMVRATIPVVRHRRREVFDRWSLMCRMRITVLGGLGAFPDRDQGCSGYLLRHDGFTMLIDPGYATLQPLLTRCAPGDVDAVVVTHGHPDHCADLHPLLRARALSGGAVQPLPLYAPAGALDAVLALDSHDVLNGAYRVHELPLPGDVICGPLTVATMPVPHFLPNAGLRITAGRTSVVYTGDGGPHEPFAEFAGGAGLLIAEATYATEVPAPQAGRLSTAADAGALAALAGAAALWLTHVWPGSDPDAHLAAARRAYAGPSNVAVPNLTWISPT